MALTRPGWNSPSLSCPEEFVKASNEVIDSVANGCGAGWKKKLVPDTIWCISIKAACIIHDWEYFWGRTKEDKELADQRFLNNMLRIIEAQSANYLMRLLRNRRALKYYEMVSIYGGPYFWKGKE